MTRARDVNPVRIAREQKGMLLIELARLAKKSPGLISSIEGGFVPKLPTMLAISDALGVSADALWPDEFEPEEA